MGKRSLAHYFLNLREVRPFGLDAAHLILCLANLIMCPGVSCCQGPAFCSKRVCLPLTF